ncbi:MAG: sugar ABC transporter ATP-binding protein [Bryobacteraceae bacterium]|nr:sugar ABC transporter ATP-binding protein [Bryobacteraceae bacterium]
MPLLEAAAITKSYAGVRALRNASFELHEGEIHALIGENGAGKSTLIKIFTGAVQPDSGSLHINGLPVTTYDPAFSRALGVVAIYQQPSLFQQLTVAENVSLGLEEPGPWRRVNWRHRHERARDLLNRVGSTIHPGRIVESLSMPEQQLVEIARAIGANAKILILDEPTASLSESEVDQLFHVIRKLREQGVGMIYISHRLEEISSIADRVTVLRDGETISTQPMRDVSRDELIRLMVGRSLSAVFPKRDVPIGETVLDVQNLSSAELGVRDVSFTLRRGEILGLSGLMGSGRTEVARLLFGLVRADSGTILLRGKRISPASPSEAIRHGIAYVPEDRRQHGVILSMPLTANTTLASLETVAPSGLIDFAREHDITRTYVDRLGVKTASVFTEAGMLSGGNQQKLAIARWLATSPSVIILDEPTQGVDVGSKSEIHSLIVDLAEQGCAILMISSELPEILGMSDKIAVMHEGTIMAVLQRHQATQQSVLSLALGHAPAAEELH